MVIGDEASEGLPAGGQSVLRGQLIRGGFALIVCNWGSCARDSRYDRAASHKSSYPQRDYERRRDTNSYQRKPRTIIVHNCSHKNRYSRQRRAAILLRKWIARLLAAAILRT